MLRPAACRLVLLLGLVCMLARLSTSSPAIPSPFTDLLLSSPVLIYVCAHLLFLLFPLSSFYLSRAASLINSVGDENRGARSTTAEGSAANNPLRVFGQTLRQASYLRGNAGYSSLGCCCRHAGQQTRDTPRGALPRPTDGRRRTCDTNRPSQSRHQSKEGRGFWPHAPAHICLHVECATRIEESFFLLPLFFILVLVAASWECSGGGLPVCSSSNNSRTNNKLRLLAPPEGRSDHDPLCLQRPSSTTTRAAATIERREDRCARSHPGGEVRGGF